MRHLSNEDIITYMDGKTPDPEKSEVDAHLAICRECSESLRQFRSLESWLQQQAVYKPQEDTVQAWISLFPPQPESQRPGLRQIIASMVFDSFDQPMLAGIRRPAAAPRQLVFRAGDIDVDVKIESTEGHERVCLSGQVLPGDSSFFDNAPVGLESNGGLRYQTHTNAMGEFSFEVPKDTYNLSIDLPEGRLMILSVHPGAAN